MTDQDKIEKLVQEAVEEAGVPAIFSEKKDKKRIVLSGLAVAIIGASVAGFEKAKKTKIPVLIKEDGYLVKVYANGEKRIVRKISSPDLIFSKHFKLK